MSRMSGINNNTSRRNIAASTTARLLQGVQPISSFEEMLKDFDNDLKKLREKFSKDSHDSPQNALENPTLWNQKIIRYERENSMLASAGLNGKPTSFVTLQGAPRPAGPIAMNLMTGMPGERERAMATAIFKHVMDYDKNTSPMSIVSGKSQALMPDLAVSLLLCAYPEGGSEQQTWDWRNDNHLRLAGGQADQLAARMAHHGINPASDQFTAAEKAAVFVLAANETFIISSSEDSAVKINGSVPNAT